MKNKLKISSYIINLVAFYYFVDLDESILKIATVFFILAVVVLINYADGIEQGQGEE